MDRSKSVGMPSGLCFPFFLGIRRRLSGKSVYPLHFSDNAALSFSAGIFQTIRSTPGVFLPLFSETRLAARHLAASDRVSFRCKALTLPGLPSRCAFAIRIWSFLTRSSSFSHGISPHDWKIPGGAFLGAHALEAFFCVPKFESPPHALATIDLPEVCLVSERHRVPIPRITRWHSLFPDSFTHLPKGVSCDRLAHRDLQARRGAYHVPDKSHEQGGAQPLPRQSFGPCNRIVQTVSRLRAVLAQACQHIWPVPVHEACGSSLLFTLPAQPGTLPRHARSHAFPSQDRLIGLRCLGRFTPSRCQPRMDR